MKKVLLVLIVIAFSCSVFAVDMLKFNISNLRSTDRVTGPWMYDFDDPGTGLTTHDGNCYTLKPGASATHLNAFMNLDWSTTGTLTTSTLIEHSLPGLINVGDVVTVTMEPYLLTGFGKINTADPTLAWNTYGQAGDRRDYTEGICHFYVNGFEKMRLLNCKIVAISPYQTAAQLRVLLASLSNPFAANWQQNVGSGILSPTEQIRVNGWGYLDPANTDAGWAAAYANPYDNQVFMDFTNSSYIFSNPYGWYTFDVSVRPAYHKESASIETVPAGGNVNVPVPASELDTYFTTAVSGGATNTLRGYTVNEVLAAPGGIYPPEILTTADKYWQLSTTLASFTADITFDFSGKYMGNPASVKVLRRPFYSTTWTVYPTTTIVDATHIKATGVTSFSEWTVASIEGPLPVELSSFNAVMASETLVNLQWTTQSETNNLGFNVYRSTDSNISNAVKLNQAIISGTNTAYSHDYSYADPEVVVNSTYYYWLENVDFNSTSNFSNYVSVRVTGADLPIIPPVTALRNAYPNPFRSNAQATIGVDVKDGENGSLTIYNTLGQVVRTFDLASGAHSLTWNGTDNHGSRVASGTYLYKLSTPSVTVTKKLVLMK